MTDVTRILSAIEQGDPSAADQLLPLVYDELRKLAAQRLAQEKPGQTLEATALVHEAYLRLVASEQSPLAPSGGEGPGVRGDSVAQVAQAAHWNSRGHFFAAAAEAMRRILVENARRKSRVKHGGGLERVEIELAHLPTHMSPVELVELDEALDALKQNDPVKARLVTLRYFGGMTIEQASEILGISRVTAHRYWTYARAWLHQRIEAGRSE